MIAVTDETTGFWGRLHDGLDDLHKAEVELRARRRAAWEEYVQRVDDLLEEMEAQLELQRRN